MTTTYRRKDLPVRVAQTIQIGDDWIGTTFVHKNPDGTPVNLTGYTIAGQLLLDDGTIIDLAMNVTAAAGSYYPSLAQSTTAGLEAGVASYEIDITDTLGRKTTYFNGPVDIKSTIPAGA